MNMITGIVVEVGSRAVVIMRDDGGTTVTAKIGPQTVISRQKKANGENDPASLNDIKVGDAVSYEIGTNGDVSVMAFYPPKKGPAGTVARLSEVNRIDTILRDLTLGRMKADNLPYVQAFKITASEHSGLVARRMRGWAASKGI